MRYRLRTLLIVLAIGPPVLAVIWWYGRIVVGVSLLVTFVVGLLILGFGGLFHLISRLHGGNDRKDTG